MELLLFAICDEIKTMFLEPKNVLLYNRFW